jgi:hypothetical protein
MILVGDSHAAHLWSSLSLQAGGDWLFTGVASCPPMSGVKLDSGVGNCLDRYGAILDFLKSRDAQNISDVVLSFYGGYAMATAYAQDHVAAKGGRVWIGS